MANRSSKKQSSRSQGSQSSMSGRSDTTSPGNEAQSCPTPGEPRRDSSISDDDMEEEEE